MPTIELSTERLETELYHTKGLNFYFPITNIISMVILFLVWCKKIITTNLDKAKLKKRSLNLCLCLIVISLFWLGFPGHTALARESTPDQTISIKPYLDRVIKKVTEFRLNNGMKFIVLERHNAPVISFVIYADVGGANEPDGKTGVAHYLEHLAFKGTKKIGTKDYEAEKPTLDKLDRIFAQIQQSKTDGKTEQVAQLKADFQKAQKLASEYVNQNEFSKIVKQAGGVGLNAATSADYTQYFYSLPANKLELWMSLESERFLDPVFREFYKEKQVILEERRSRTENSPVAQLLEQFLDKAFLVHPYGRPVIGYSEDIQNLTREDVRDFFDTHYVPSNLTVGIVGDVNPKKVKKLAKRYFGRYKVKQKPPRLNILEPTQNETREVTMKLQSQPWYIEGYHRPAVNHPDNAIYNMIASIMSNGRTSRLYQSLVEKQKIALVARGFSGYPGSKYPHLMLFYAMTAPNRNIDEVGSALQTEIERLKTELVSEQELERVKTQARAGLLRSLDSNMGMATALLNYEIKTGSWQNLFKELDAINAVTAEDIQRVAQETFVAENRTIGRLLPKVQ